MGETELLDLQFALLTYAYCCFFNVNLLIVLALLIDFFQEIVDDGFASFQAVTLFSELLVFFTQQPSLT